MKSWDIRTLDALPHAPKILSTTDDARAIVLSLPAGERLQEHEVHERAWVVVADGEVEITSAAGGDGVSGGPGLLVELAPRERHEVAARTDARLLLLLTPWPGEGHPGALTMEQKENARRDAAERAP